jgi:hypothetical protein
MSLFQCENCGCCENTALSCQGFKFIAESFDWSYAPEREGLNLCSACGPISYKTERPTKYGKWHEEFERVFLPMGEFHTNRVGNLEHTATGSEDFRGFAIVRGTAEIGKAMP